MMTHVQKIVTFLQMNDLVEDMLRYFAEALGHTGECTQVGVRVAVLSNLDEGFVGAFVDEATTRCRHGSVLDRSVVQLGVVRGGF